jgi:hypothetical protein
VSVIDHRDAPPDHGEIPLSVYLDEPAARGMRLARGPDLDLPRRQQADSAVQPWPWRPTRSLDQLLPEILAFLEAEVRADELADAQAAGEEKAA